VAAKCPPEARSLAADVDAQDIVTLNLSRAIQMCVDIGAHLISSSSDEPVPSTMGQTFQRLGAAGVIPAELARRLQRAVGFRNIVVHNYEVIDWEVVHSLARNHLDDFAAFVAAVVTYQQRRGDSL
jgi:uncharacterized protein YutE (UPF0331/DUF86 family)